MLTQEQIEAMVMAKYPRTDKERTCRQEKERLKSLREFYRSRLEAEKYTAPTLN